VTAGWVLGVYVAGLIALVPTSMVIAYLADDSGPDPSYAALLALFWPLVIAFLWLAGALILVMAIDKWRWRRLPHAEKQRRVAAFNARKVARR